MNKIMTAVLACLFLITGLLQAMPPREGLKEPASVIEARKQGMDSPKDGLIQQIKAKGGEAKISGSRSYPVVMGYFTDLASTFTQANFQILLFNRGTGVKSVNNYYRDMSYNAMSCSGSVAAWASSGNTQTYYGNSNNGLTTSDTIRSAYGFIKKTLIACDAAVDFSKPEYDSDQNGEVDVLWVVHAGKGGEETYPSTLEIWSHSWNLTYWMSSKGKIFTTNDISHYTGKAVTINKYIIMPEKTDASGAGTNKIIGAGVFCHEFGHALGLPDLYDTGGVSISGQGLGQWSCMASGSWGGDGATNATPTSLDVWCKRFLGWITPYNVVQNGKYSFNHIINTVSYGAVRLAKLGSASATQYWLVENRSKTAVGPVSGVAWDANLLGAGLAIYHIDNTYTSATYIGNNNVNVNTTTGASRNRPYGVAMEETDQTAATYTSELWTGTNRGDAADCWTASTQANFDSTGTAYPISYLNDGTSKAGIAVRKIPAAGKAGDLSKAMTCTLYVIPAGPLGVNLSQFTACSGQNGITLNWRTESEMESYAWAIERTNGPAENYRTIASLPAYGTTNSAHDYSYTDDSPELATGVYYYRLIQTDASNEENSFGPVEVSYVRPGPAALEYALMPAFPNPTKGGVSFNYSLKQAGAASLRVYNLLGLEVATLADGWKQAGAYTAVWDGRDSRGKNSANGVYFYKLVSGDFSATKKITILR
jgi:M6 family metalloprotease-like protein